MGVSGREMVEEVFSAGQHVFGDLVILEQQVLRQLPYSWAGIRQVADLGRRVDPREIWVNSRCAPCQDRDRKKFLPRICWQQLRAWKVASYPNLDRDVFGES